MSSSKNKIIKNLTGSLLQTPMFFVLLFGVCITVVNIVYSFCEIVITTDGFQAHFIGIENYYNVIMSDWDTVPFLIETIDGMIFALCVCMVVMALALFISKLKPVFGAIAIAILSLCSVGAWFTCQMELMKHINITLFSSGILNEPIVSWGSVANIIIEIFYIVPIVAPIFLITYFFAKLGKKTVGILVSVFAIPVLMVGSFYCQSNFPYFDLLQGRGRSGQVDIAMAMLVMAMVLFAVWCVVLLPVLFGISRLVKLIKLPQKLIKVLGYIAFALVSLSASVLLLAWMVSVVNNSFIPLRDSFMQENTLYAKMPLLSNFLYLFDNFISCDVSISQMLRDIVIIFVIALVTVLPSAIGMALIKNKFIKAIFIIWLIPLAAYIPFAHMFFKETMINIGTFFSGVGFIIVFLSIYALTKFTINSKKHIVIKSILSVLCAISTIFSVAVATPWFNEYLTFTQYIDEYMGYAYSIYYNPHLLSEQFNFYGFQFAYQLLIFAMVIALAIVPASLFLAVYILSKKKEKQA